MNRLGESATWSYHLLYFLPSGLATLAGAADLAEREEHDEGAGDAEDLGTVLLDRGLGVVAGGDVLDLGAGGGDTLALGDLLGRGDGGVLDGAGGGRDGGADGRDDLLGGAAVVAVAHAVSRGVVVEILDGVGGHG